MTELETKIHEKLQRNGAHIVEAAIRIERLKEELEAARLSAATCIAEQRRLQEVWANMQAEKTCG